MVSVYDYLVFEENGAGAIAVHAGEWARADLPEHVAVEVVRGDEHFVAVEEAEVNPLAVGGGCRGCVTVEAVDSLEGGDEDEFLIEDFAVCAVESEQHSLSAVLDSCYEEDSVFPDYWGGVPFARQRGLPDDVLCIAPFNGNIILDARAVSSRASPGGPILGFGKRGDGSDQDQEQEQKDELVVMNGIGNVFTHFGPRLAERRIFEAYDSGILGAGPVQFGGFWRGLFPIARGDFQGENSVQGRCTP